MTKYAPLKTHLTAAGLSQIPMSFKDIEVIISDRLPASARKHRAWWSNNPSNSVITNSWLAAGYKTADVNLEAESVVFVKTNADRPPDRPVSGNNPVLGCMKNTITVPEGVDVAEPAMPEWAEMGIAGEQRHG